jgi:hypothetical protein
VRALTFWRKATYWKSGAAGAALKFARTPSVSSTWLRQWRRTSSFSCVCAAGANSISPLVRSFARSLLLLQLQSEQLVCAPQKSSSLTIRNKSAAASHGARHFFPIHRLVQKCTHTLEIANENIARLPLRINFDHDATQNDFAPSN